MEPSSATLEAGEKLQAEDPTATTIPGSANVSAYSYEKRGP